MINYSCDNIDAAMAHERFREFSDWMIRSGKWLPAWRWVEAMWWLVIWEGFLAGVEAESKKLMEKKDGANQA